MRRFKMTDLRDVRLALGMSMVRDHGAEALSVTTQHERNNHVVTGTSWDAVLYLRQRH